MNIDGFGGRDGEFRINRCGMKRYPAQGGTLSAIPLAIEIAKDAGGVANLDRIEVSVGHGVYISAVRDAEKWHPATRATADHSLPYIIARAMIDGDIDDESYEPAKLEDPAIHKLMARMTVQEDPALTAMSPRLPTIIKATTRDGKTIVRQMLDAPGSPESPFSRQDVEAKFRASVRKHMTEDQTRRALSLLWNLDAVQGVDEISQCMRVI